MSLKIAVLRNLNELQENTEGQFKNSGRAMWMKWDFFFFFTYIEIINKEPNRVFPECLVVRIWCLHCYALGSIPDQETEIFKLCHEANKRKEKKKRNQTEKKSRRTEQKFCSLRLHWMKCNQMKKKKRQQEASATAWIQQKNFWNRRQDYWHYQPEGKEEKGMQKSERNPGELWDDIHRNNLHITGVPEGEEREKWTEIVLKEVIPDNSQI